jgi:hypothetical protein
MIAGQTNLTNWFFIFIQSGYLALAALAAFAGLWWAYDDGTVISGAIGLGGALSDGLQYAANRGAEVPQSASDVVLLFAISNSRPSRIRLWVIRRGMNLSVCFWHKADLGDLC